jgi:REP element-mobilizing transposase RayT
VGAMFRTLCDWKGIKLVEGEVCKDHIHMLLEIPPKYSVSSVMGYLKGKSSIMIYEKWGFNGQKCAKYRRRNDLITFLEAEMIKKYAVTVVQ